MFCPNCGCEVPEQSNYCPRCGADQGGKPSKKKQTGPVKVAINAVLIFCGTLLAMFGLLVLVAGLWSASRESDDSSSFYTLDQSYMTEAAAVKDGWYTEDGKRYYYENGEMYVDLQKIAGDYYYFKENGVLAVNETVRLENVTCHAGGDGKIDQVIFDSIGGRWAEEDYYPASGVSSSVFELSMPVVDCTSMTFHLEASGNHGAKTNGNWKIYIRNNGRWEYLQTINFTEPSGDFDFVFSKPMSFDAISAYPTVRGNATYSALFYPKNVTCPFDSIKDLL